MDADVIVRLIDRYGLWTFGLIVVALVVRDVAKSFLPPLGQVIIDKYKAEVDSLRENTKAIAQLPGAIASFEKTIGASESRTRAEVATSEARTRAEVAAAKAEVRAHVDAAVADIKEAISDDRTAHLTDKLDKISRRASIPDSDPPSSLPPARGHRDARQ